MTDDGESEVHLGPTAFLSEHGVAFAGGAAGGQPNVPRKKKEGC
jgi:hypothetical protein